MRQDLPPLRQGDTGAVVAILQRLLVLYGYANTIGAVDGDFGSKTTNAVVQFQRQQNLRDKDGIVGGETWNQLAYPAGAKVPAS